MTYKIIEELQKDFDIKAYDFYIFYHDGKICLSSRVGLNLCSFFIPFNYKKYIVYLC